MGMAADNGKHRVQMCKDLAESMRIHYPQIHYSEIPVIFNLTHTSDYVAEEMKYAGDRFTSRYFFMALRAYNKYVDYVIGRVMADLSYIKEQQAEREREQRMIDEAYASFRQNLELNFSRAKQRKDVVDYGNVLWDFMAFCGIDLGDTIELAEQYADNKVQRAKGKLRNPKERMSGVQQYMLGISSRDSLIKSYMIREYLRQTELDDLLEILTEDRYREMCQIKQTPYESVE